MWPGSESEVGLLMSMRGCTVAATRLASVDGLRQVGGLVFGLDNDLDLGHGGASGH
jgi:hypothetical protein